MKEKIIIPTKKQNMEISIFSMENWWRWLIMFIIIVAACYFFSLLAKSLFAKPKGDDQEGDANTRRSFDDVYPTVYKRNHTDIASMDSGTNTSAAASVAIDAAINV